MKNMRCETCKVVLFFLLLTMLNPRGLAYANEDNGEALDSKELVAKESMSESTVADNQKYIADLENKYGALKKRINDLENQGKVTNEITKLNESVSKVSDAIEDASSGIFSSILNWIFQVIGIAVGAGVAIYVMQQQTQNSWAQFQENQLLLQQSAEESSRESWKQLLYSLGVQEDLQDEKFQREAHARLMENEKVQEALRIGLEIYVGVLSDYSGLAVNRIRSISEKPEEVRESISSVEFPTLPPGLWENLHSYTNVIGSSSGVAIVASHLYDFGRHYSEIKKQDVLSSIEMANQSGDELKKQELEKAIKNLKEYKKEMAEYFEDIQVICENQNA